MDISCRISLKFDLTTIFSAIRRCIFPSTDTPIYFSDIVLADIFTSFAKVIGDVWLSFCMVIPGGSLLIFPAQDGWGSVMVPCLMRYGRC